MEREKMIEALNSIGLRLPWGTVERCVRTTDVKLHYRLVVWICIKLQKKQGAIKAIIDVSTIIVSCAIGLLLAKTLIECKLYGIPFPVKIVKNAVAFGVDCACMILGYFIILPRVLKSRKYNIPVKEQKTNFEEKDGEEE